MAKRRTKAERAEWLLRCDVIAATTAFVVHRVRTMGREPEAGDVMQDCLDVVPRVLDGALDEPGALVVFRFDALTGLSGLVSDKDTALTEFCDAAERDGARLIGLNPARIMAAMRQMASDGTLSHPLKMGASDGRAALH